MILVVARVGQVRVGTRVRLPDLVGVGVLAVDGFTMKGAKAPGKVEELGVPANDTGVGSFPRVRVVALAETGTRSLQGVRVGPLSEGEQTMARRLWPSCGRGDVVVGDRGFLSYEDLRAIIDSGAHAVLRAKADIETRLRPGPHAVLRSKSPDMVRQEIYGLLCTYQAIRALIAAGAEETGLDPDRISFTRAKQAAERHLSDDSAFSPCGPA